MSLNSSPNNSTLPDSTLPESNSNMSTTIPLDPVVILNIPISTKLNRSNFLAWKSEITPALHGHGLYRYLTEDPPSEQLTVDGTQHTNPRFSHWHQRDQLILSWMRSSLSDTILGQVVSCTSAAELWKSLQKSFSATSRARLSELRHSLQTTTKEGLSCSDYCQEIRSIADELAFIGHPVTDDELVLQVLCGLGSEFNSFVVEASMKDHLSFNELQAMLQSHENLLQAQLGERRDNGLDMNPHPGQQATQQRIEVNANNNDSNNTAPSNLEEEEILRREHHHRLDNLISDIWKTKSMDELNALIDSFTN